MSERPTFSQSWSRVSRLTPTLRPQVEIHRQVFHGEPWHIVHDPISNNFFRLNPVAYHFIGLLDGQRSVDDAWKITMDSFGDAAPTQHEVIGLLGQLNESNLLRIDLPADAHQLLKRNQKRKVRFWAGQAMSIVSLKIPVFNPNRMLDILLPLFRPFLTIWGLIAWIIFLAIAIGQFSPYITTFAKGVDPGSVLDPNNWGWLMILFVLTKAWHELGHGIMCKRFGGSVPETGIMFLVFFPAPYVDATSSWNFASKWHRILVASAGMMFEFILAGIATFVWVYSAEHTLARQLAFNTIFLCSVTTFFFNANPLLRFDGYYILADLIEVPNLYQRSSRYIQYIFQRYAFGMKNVQPVSTLAKEKLILFVYGILSQIYRALVMFGIALYVMTQFFIIGIIIAFWSVISWALIPTVKFVYWLLTSPALYERRFRAISVTVICTAIVLFFTGVVPYPDYRRVDGVIESENKAIITISEPGFVVEALAKPGDQVKKGQLLLRLKSPELEAELAKTKADILRTNAIIRGSYAKEPIERQLAQAKLDSQLESLGLLQKRILELNLTAPCDGQLMGELSPNLTGVFLSRADTVATIEDITKLRVTALIPQEHNASQFTQFAGGSGIANVECRKAGAIDQIFTAQIQRIYAAGTKNLPHPGMGHAHGGPIATDQQDQHGMTSHVPYFEMWLKLPEHDKDGVRSHPAQTFPGQRVYIRLTLAERKPLLYQWIHTVRQAIRDRLQV
jgi:putative peptide zinc metalloprotease protein